MRVYTNEDRVYHIVMTAMMMCIIMLAIMLLRIPIPFTQGYVNLSDAMIFMAVFGIKAAMAIIFGLIIQSACARKKISGRRFMTVEIMGMILAGLFMTGGYYLAEGIMYGNWAVAVLGIPWNIAQFAVGAALAVALNRALAKTSLRSHMAYAMPLHL